MGKRNGSSKKERREKDAARNVTLLTSLRGVPCVDEGRLWLLRDVAPPCPLPDGLAAALCQDRPPPLKHWRHCLTPQQALPVDLPLLSGWTKALAELEAGDLAGLIAGGGRPLRRFRATDLPDWLAARRRSLELLGRLLR